MTAPKIDPQTLAGLSPEEKRALLKRLLHEQVSASKHFAMSSQQQGLWHAFRRDPNSTSYNVFLPTRIRSRLDLTCLEQAMRSLAARHDALRSTFSDDGGKLRQTVHDQLEPEFVVHDALGQTETSLKERVLEETQRPFQLSEGPLLRLAVFRVADDDHVVVATTHHIVTDFWSLIVIMEELATIYPALLRGQTPRLPAATNNYSDYVRRQQSILNGSERQRLSRYWNQQAEGVDPVLTWFTDFKRPDTFTGNASAVAIPLDQATSQRVRTQAKRMGVTVNAVLMAALQKWIHHCTLQERFLIGNPCSGRSTREFERTVGLFSGILPLRAEIRPGETFEQLTRRVSATLLAALDHEDYPFLEIVKDIQPPRETSRGPLIQTICTFENSQSREEQGRAAFLMPESGSNASEPSSDVGGLLQTPFPIEHPTCHHDLEFAFETSLDAIGGMICYCVDLFERSSVIRMADQFVEVLQRLIQDPTVPMDRSPWSDSARLVGDPPLESSSASLANLLQDSMHRYANHPAIGTGSKRLEFDWLEQQTKIIADQLTQAGVKHCDFVPVVGPSDAAIVPAILGVIRHGAIVVPIDASQPSISQQELVQQTGARVLLELDQKGNVRCKEVSQEASKRSASQPPSETPTSTTYMIYTSGSTGTPKGVLVEDAAIRNTLDWRRHHVKIGPGDRVLMLLSHQFDAGFGLILETVTQGACLVWPKTTTDAFDLDAIIDNLMEQQITVLTATPSLLMTFCDHPRFEECRSIRQIWTGGEAMPSELPSRIRSRLPHQAISFWNFYGPTETAIEATACLVPLDHSANRNVGIGRPISGVEIQVLDPSHQPLPEGLPGQIAILGAGLAQGYLNDPSLNQQRFIELSSPKFSKDKKARRAYLTGDLGRIRNDGEIEFLGRLDNQVKLRGYRIELEEIDQRLRDQPGVQDAATCVVGQGNQARLIGFVVGANSQVNLDLPRFKRPDAIHVVEIIPRTAGGKIDRRRLSSIATEKSESSSAMVLQTNSFTTPRNDLERFLVSAWAETLMLDSVSTNENFFDAGGSSLQAAMLTSKLSEALQFRIPPSLLFDLTDIRGMAETLAQLYPSQVEARFGIASLGQPNTDSSATHPLIAAWQPNGSRPPIFMVHPPGGIVVCYRELAQHLSPNQPLYAIRSRGLHGDEPLPSSLVEMARDYVEAIEATVQDGPVVLGGWSLGGLVAAEMTHQLERKGRLVERLLLLDTTIPESASKDVPIDPESRVGLEYGIDLTLDQLSQLAPEDQLPFLWDHAKKLGVLDETAPAEVVQQMLADLQKLFHLHVSLANQHRLAPIPVPILLMRPTHVPVEVQGPRDRGWSALAEHVQVMDVPGHHHSMLSEPHVGTLAKQLLAR